MALENVDEVLTGRGLMDCLQYYDNCLLILKPLLVKIDSSRFKVGQIHFTGIGVLGLNIKHSCCRIINHIMNHPLFSYSTFKH
jgi:hypothetical protein